MDKKFTHLLRDYHDARRAYLKARLRLLDHLLRLRRKHQARQPRPIELPGYDKT